MKKFFKVLAVMLIGILVLTGCGGDEDIIYDNSDNEPEYIGDIIDNTTILIRDGEFVDVITTSDRDALYFYLDDDSHELLDTAIMPMQDYTDNWYISDIETNDLTGNKYSDLIIHITHADNSETLLFYVWNENDHFLYQEFYSYFKKTPEIGEDTVPDYSAYAGYWVSTADNMYEGIYLDIDTEGNWKLYYGDELADEGYLYIIEGEGIYVYSYNTGALDGGKAEIDGELLYIETAGYFEYTNDIQG